MASKYFKTTITYEVLSKGEPVQFESMADLHAATYDGDCSGHFIETKIETLTEDEMRAALIAQGSDPEFLINNDQE